MKMELLDASGSGSVSESLSSNGFTLFDPDADPDSDPEFKLAYFRSSPSRTMAHPITHENRFNPQISMNRFLV